MFWIIGGDYLASSLASLSKNEGVHAVAAQVSDHVEWVGFRFYDMIFPLFLFIIGVALPFSVGRRIEAGEDRGRVVRKVLARSAVLFFLGLIYNGLLQFEGWDHLRLFGVLQRLAVGYFAASLFVVYTKPKTQAMTVVGILLGYWALMALAPVPGFHPGTYTPEGNFANYIDRFILLPGQMYTPYGDPEGPISDIPAIATALLGVLTGYWLRSERDERGKTGRLLICGAVSVLLGLAWAPFFPIIKKIWTSSYVLMAGGFSMMLVAAFHWIIDVKGKAKWAKPFVWIGMNSILIYMLSEMVDFAKTGGYFLGGLAQFAPAFKEPITAAGMLITKLGLLYFLYRQKVFLRV